MVIGYDASLPLTITEEDGAYGLLKTSELSVRQNIKNILLTSPGERMFDSSFGVGLRRILFEPNTSYTINQIKNIIGQQISIYAPYVSIGELAVFKSQDGTGLYITLSYTVNTLQSYTDYIQLNFNNVETI